MNVTIRDSSVFRAISPADVLGYLRTSGWTERRTVPNRESVWTHGDDLEVVVPLSPDLKDFAARVADVLSVLTVTEQRSEIAVLQDVVTASADVIRIQLETFEAASGSIPIEEGVSLVERARDMLLAAASAAVDPRPSYGPKRPGQAMDYLRGVRLGQTERGSYVVTLISRVTPDLAPAANAAPIEEPFERKAVETLARAVSATAEAAQRALVRGAFDEFDRRVADGVNANLCDALVGMAGGADTNRDLTFHFSWARNRRPRPDAVARVKLDAAMFPAIAEAARVFREITPEAGYFLYGPVVRLDRQEHEQQGRAVVLDFVPGGRPRRVTLELDAETYRKAVEAHDQKVPLAAVGTLAKEGRSYALRDPHSVEVDRATDEAGE